MKSVDIQVIDKEFYAKYGFPAYMTTGSAGMDLRAAIYSAITVFPNQDKGVLIPTGFALNMGDTGMCATLLPRSSLGHKKGLVLANTVGLIDSDYQGEIYVSCWNRSNNDYTIKPGERIAQLVFLPIIQARFNLVESFQATVRGEGGFGSTTSKK